MKTKRKSKPQRITKVVVEKVETDWVGVHWQCCAYSKGETWSDQSHPKFVVEGDDLKKLRLLNVFEPSTLQVGDRNFYVIKGNETLITREQWRKHQRELFQVSKSPRRNRNTSSSKAAVEEKIKRERRERSLEKNIHNVNDENKVNNEKDVASNNLLVPPSVNITTNESSDDWDTEDTGSHSDSDSVM